MILFPSGEVYMLDDAIKRDFINSKYHLDIAATFSYIIDKILRVPMGGVFDCIGSPEDFEPIEKAHTHLAKRLSTGRNLLEKHKDIIATVEFSIAPTYDTKYVQSIANKYNTCVGKTSKTSYDMFVDPFFIHRTL